MADETSIAEELIKHLESDPNVPQAITKISNLHGLTEKQIRNMFFLCFNHSPETWLELHISCNPLDPKIPIPTNRSLIIVNRDLTTYSKFEPRSKTDWDIFVEMVEQAKTEILDS